MHVGWCGSLECVEDCRECFLYQDVDEPYYDDEDVSNYYESDE
ncbi:MAG: hypothetical protein ACYTEQ_01745 [Planctomycetota bacterium]|jgi:hypothetical protein